MLAQPEGRLATEEDAHNPSFLRKSEEAALELRARGVQASVLRLPPSVHGNGDHGFVPRLINITRENGVPAFIDDGLNGWAAVHRLDAAHLSFAIDRPAERVNRRPSDGSAGLYIATRGLHLDERAEYRGPRILKVNYLLQSALQQSLDSALRLRPRQRGFKRGDGGEEAVGRRQRTLVNEILRRGDGTPVEGGDAACAIRSAQSQS